MELTFINILVISKLFNGFPWEASRDPTGIPLATLIVKGATNGHHR